MGIAMWFLGQKCHVAVTRIIQMKDGNVSPEGTDLPLQVEMQIKRQIKEFVLGEE